jgi:glycosyltransferase involved in cell wall biosynthesis
MAETRFSTLRHVYADQVLFPLAHRAPFSARHGLLFVGNLNNPTNHHGLLWFVRDVWPLVRKAEPRITLTIAGSLEGEGTSNSGLGALLGKAAGVVASGYVADDELGPLLQSARVFIAPIRWATGIVTKQTLAHVHGLPSVVTPTAARHVAPAPLDADGVGDAWSHTHGRYVPVKVSAVAEAAADFAAAVLHVHTNESAWDGLSVNGARYARSGGGGKGVCPAGLGDDWLAFWSKLQTACCSGSF